MTIAINIITTLLLIPWGGMVMMSPMMVAAGGFKDSLSSILTAMGILGYPVIIFALLKFMGWPYFGMEAESWLIGSMIVVSGIFLVYNFPGMLRNLNRGVPNTGYFVGESAVYLDGDKIPKAEPGSFEILKLDYSYAKDRAHIYLRGEIVEGADPKTFTAVNNLKHQSSEVTTPL